MRRLAASVLMCLMFVCGANAESIRFAVVGDTQGWSGMVVNEEGLPAVVQAIGAQQPPVQFVIFAGDLISGTWDPFAHAEQFNLWWGYIKPLVDAGIGIYAAPGNHDQSNELLFSAQWQTAFPNLPANGPEEGTKMTYSFDSGPCHFTVVNTSSPWRLHQVNLDWLEKDLAASNQPVKIVVGHDPAYPIHRHKQSSLDAYPDERDKFWQILVRYGVKAYFCGHEHVYDHWMKDDVHQIIVGGASGVQYAIVDADESDVRYDLYNYASNVPADSAVLSNTESVAKEDRVSAAQDFTDDLTKTVPCLTPFMIILASMVGLMFWIAPRR